MPFFGPPISHGFATGYANPYVLGSGCFQSPSITTIRFRLRFQTAVISTNRCRIHKPSPSLQTAVEIKAVAERQSVIDRHYNCFPPLYIASFLPPVTM